MAHIAHIAQHAPASVSRRRLLQASASGALLGSFGARLGAPLAALGSAAAHAAGVTDYRALVCVYLAGGNDTSNFVLPTDADSWARYQAARNQGASPIALAAPGTAANPSAVRGTPAWLGGVLPIVPATTQPWPAGTQASGGARTFALHPQLVQSQNLFTTGKLAVVANLGTLLAPTTKAQVLAGSARLPINLYSHSDQTSEWQSGNPQGARVGYGGELGDVLAQDNGANTIFTTISTAGNAVFLAGNQVVQYEVAGSGAVAINALALGSLFGSVAGPAALSQLITSQAGTSFFELDYAAMVQRSINAQATLNAALASVNNIAAPTTYVDPISGNALANSLALQLQTVARIASASAALGTKRQVFFVTLGGFDTHANQNSYQPRLMAQIDHGLNYFYGALAGASLQDSVTAFTMSEFARTFTTNGTGTDHAWGAHHFVMGGAVHGGDIIGQFPTVGVDLASTGFTNPNAVGSGALIPGIATDQYLATLGAWLGASSADLATIFPNLGNFASANLGFV